MPKIQFECPACKRLFDSGRIGRVTGVLYPATHRRNGELCPGNARQAHLVGVGFADLEGSVVVTELNIRGDTIATAVPRSFFKSIPEGG